MTPNEASMPCGGGGRGGGKQIVFSIIVGGEK